MYLDYCETYSFGRAIAAYDYLVDEVALLIYYIIITNASKNLMLKMYLIVIHTNIKNTCPLCRFSLFLTPSIFYSCLFRARTFVKGTITISRHAFIYWSILTQSAVSVNEVNIHELCKFILVLKKVYMCKHWVNTGEWLIVVIQYFRKK